MFDKAFIQELAKAIAVEVAKIVDATPKVAPRYLSLEQAAVYLDTTKDGVRGMARAKLFPIKKAGTRTFIDIHDIDEAMQSNTSWAAEIELSPRVNLYPNHKSITCEEQGSDSLD
ncbi:MAG: helix-turn-helix domain-containing protein [Bryobacterales bacterium]|nr:helix-turn-helix domain-containing protein [Bryobacterales bacterium]